MLTFGSCQGLRCIDGVTGRTSNIVRAACTGNIIAFAVVAVNGEDKGWQSTTTIVRAPRFPRIERTLSARVVLCNSTVADKREEEELDGDVTQRSQGVCNFCLRASQ